MKDYLKKPSLGHNITIILMSLAIMGLIPIFRPEAIKADQASLSLSLTEALKIQDNTLIAISNPNILSLGVVRKMDVVVTAYSSTVEETDDTPFITASGTNVRNGIVANNSLPFGTKIRMPELYGNTIFVVEDRMNRKKEDYHFDVWLPSHTAAENFGVKWTYVEILAS